MASLPNEARPVTVQVARHLVRNTAPEEMALFDELAQEYFADPTPPERGAGGADDPLAFGVEATLAAATPAALAMASAALGFIATEVVKASQEQAAGYLVAEIKKRFRPKSADMALNREQLKHVYQAALAQGALYGLEKEQADTMARALVGTLALGPA